MFIDRRLIAQIDWGLLGVSIVIPLLGLVVLYSAGYDPDGSGVVLKWLPATIHSPAAVKQALYVFIGLFVMLVGSSLSPQVLQRYAYVIYGLCIVSLLLVLLFGTVSHGSRRWISIAGYSFQPAEAMKLGLIIGLARFISKNPPSQGGYGFVQLIVPFLLFGIPTALIIRQPDLGTALAIAAVGFLIVLFVGIRMRALLCMGVSVAMLLLPAWHSLHQYQKRRILALINPEADPLGSGYHIIQSKIAVGSGAVTGKGFLQGTQTQLQFLPEHTTDFVFSVLAEEWGFIGAVCVLLLYLFLIYRLLRVVVRSSNLFASLLAIGVATQIFFHLMVNIGMVVGLLPVVGLPLPLFSYGGSSVLCTMFAIGLVQGLGMRRFLFAQ